MLVAFGHQSRVGKDTACNALANTLNEVNYQTEQSLFDVVLARYSLDKAVIFSFAKPLYNLTETVQKYYKQPVEKDRGLLQALGGWGRSEDPFIWINIMREKIKRAMLDGQSVFISDVRYTNEFHMLKSLGFTMVKIERADRPIDGDPNHPSETELANANWDQVITNDGTELEFTTKIINYFYKK